MVRICWITSSFLLDVDIPIVPHLQKEYEIDWIILTTSGNKDGDKRLIEATGCTKYRMVEKRGVFIHPRQLDTMTSGSDI